MAYTSVNFKTKKALKEAVAAGNNISVYQPSPYGNKPIDRGVVYLEGPHYPQPHRWYAEGFVENGVLTKVK